jgi:uncharacterized protein
LDAVNVSPRPADLVLPFLAVLALQCLCVLIMRTVSVEVVRASARAALQVLIGHSFALGLICSGMSVPLKVASFFDVLRPTWDPSLLFVFPGALLFSSLAFRAVENGQSPVMDSPKHCLPARSAVTPKLAAGAALFGCGWGLAGVCPGPALVLFATSLRWTVLLPSVLTWFAGYVAGLSGVTAALCCL